MLDFTEPTPEQETLATELVREATSGLGRFLSGDVNDAIVTYFVDELLFTPEGWRQLRRAKGHPAVDVQSGGGVSARTKAEWIQDAMPVIEVFAGRMWQAWPRVPLQELLRAARGEASAAADEYYPERGVSFIAFALPRIRGKMISMGAGEAFQFHHAVSRIAGAVCPVEPEEPPSADALPPSTFTDRASLRERAAALVAVTLMYEGRLIRDPTTSNRPDAVAEDRARDLQNSVQRLGPMEGLTFGAMYVNGATYETVGGGLDTRELRRANRRIRRHLVAALNELH